MTAWYCYDLVVIPQHQNLVTMLCHPQLYCIVVPIFKTLEVEIIFVFGNVPLEIRFSEGPYVRVGETGELTYFRVDEDLRAVIENDCLGHVMAEVLHIASAPRDA